MRYCKPCRGVVFGLLLFISLGGWCQKSATLFRLVPAAQTGIDFKNQITESDSINILNQANIYNGGGVGIGDFNNDGLVDVYFAGNMVSNKLYLNKGALKFEDITSQAGVGGNGRWCTGVSVTDINADGWLDIYVSASFQKDVLSRTNLLYINNGLNKSGLPTFTESAAPYGLADTGFSTQGYFFDYDKDGDLDMYQVTNQLNDPKTPIKFRPKVTDGSALNTDRLYRNNGNGTFTNVSKQAGILVEGWGHAACITDINMDGWPDVYVANDFVSNDILYINNKDGTFTNRLGEYFKHTGWNAMGTDAVDINNDGLTDFISLEMLPEDNLRKKRMLGGNEYYNYTNSARYGYEHQYIRNVLQINSGPTPKGHPIFTDLAYMAGVYQTDWSWCPLVADFDNDGFRDIIISNGLPRDVTDLDYIEYNNGQGGGKGVYTLAMTDSLPVVRLQNYAYKNKGGSLFENKTEAWGLTHSSFSNGAAYADLDNDGDLDVLINNINDVSFVYENTTSAAPGKSHRITVSIAGEGKNINGFGAVLRIYYGGNQQQVYEHQPCRGYLSTDDARAHFGLGQATTADSLRIHWPDGKSQLILNVRSGQSITLSHKDASEKAAISLATSSPPLFSNVGSRLGVKFRPKERDFVDYDIQPTMPHKLSQYGPGISVGDVDKNGYEDFFLGGSSGNRGVFFMQDQKGMFSLDSSRFLQKDDPLFEDMGVLLFDADGDEDLDLYVVSGSYEVPPNHRISQDRLYLNNGEGRFTKSTTALPIEFSNGSCVRAADFDSDGDLDLFVGGRVVSGAYPTAPQSFLLRNESGIFVDVTKQFCQELQRLGMITDAIWSDFDNDGKVDIVIAGEWMPLTFFKNTGTAFVNLGEASGTSKNLGWWNSLAGGDFDNDGDIDYIAGNLGLNTNYKATREQPLTLFAKDVDDNGSIDPMVFCYMKDADGTMKPFPMATRNDMISQVISIRKKYPTYKSFGRAAMENLWTSKDREGAMMLQTNDMASCYIENTGDGHFKMSPLPFEAQVAPVYGTLAWDVNGDGNLDLLMVGNDYGIEPYSGRHDAFMGLYLQGDGKGKFTVVPVGNSGFFVNGDGKGLAVVHSATNEDLLVATQNQDSLLVFGKNQKPATAPKSIALKSDDFSAELTYKDGRKRKEEFYYGSTYLSQSSRTLSLDKDVVKCTITSFKGTKRSVL